MWKPVRCLDQQKRAKISKCIGVPEQNVKDELLLKARA